MRWKFVVELTVSMKNDGKRFEEDFVKSVPDHVLIKRLNDNAAAWSGGENTRFSSNNECDFILFDDNTRTFYGLELKSTKEKSLTFWREDFDVKGKKQSFMIKRCQIQGLQKWSQHFGVFGFIINFRSLDNKTYFIMIDDFLDYTSTMQKKSININDVLEMNPIELKSELSRTRYKYDIEQFLRDTRL
jgi:recombination protein U